MQSDDELQTTLSKWPFILGDVLLVGTALAIAILGNWQLTNWQVAACVMSVALGAALFALPYIVEFQVRIREEAEDRSADLRILHRQIVSTQDQQEALADQIETLGEGVANLRQSKPDLSVELKTFEQQIEPLRQSKEAQGRQLDSLAEQINKLTGQVEALSAASETQVKMEAIDALRSGLDAVRSKVDAVKGQVDAVQSEVDELPSKVETAVATDSATESVAVEPTDAGAAEVAPEDRADAEADAGGDAGADAEVEAKKTRAPRQRRRPEPRLMQRAIDDSKDHSSAAVSRIIEYKKKPLAETAPEPVRETANAAVEEDQISADPSENEEAVDDASIETPAEAGAAESLEVQDVSSEAADSAVSAETPDPRKSEEAGESRAEAKGDRESSSEPEATVEETNPEPPAERVSEPAAASVDLEPSPKASEPEPDAEPVEGADMFAEAVPPQVTKRARIKKSDTAIIASVFIGIGNKPYVRGSGAGLNWEAGVPMEFEEIGKWRWLAPADLAAPVEIQLFRNDEDPDASGKYTLEPGQQLELSPIF